LRSELRLLATATHQLSQPLTAIRGSLELALLWRDKAEERDEVLREALDQTDRLIQCTRGLADFAEAHRPHRTNQNVALGMLLDAVVDRLRPLAKARSVNIVLEHTPNITVRANPGRLSVAVLNVIDNAIKYSPERSTVRISLRASAENVCITIRDEGPGFPDDALNHLFEPFFRGREAAQQAPGAGLGLSIAKCIVQAHGGDMEVANQNPGASVRLLIPVVPSKVEIPARSRQSSRRLAANRAATPARSSRRLKHSSTVPGV
jgi:signal transduction histidine kinase